MYQSRAHSSHRIAVSYPQVVEGMRVDLPRTHHARRPPADDDNNDDVDAVAKKKGVKSCSAASSRVCKPRDLKMPCNSIFNL